MEVAEGDKVALEQPRQEAEIHTVSKLRVQIVNLQIDLQTRSYKTFFTAVMTFELVV